MKQPFRSGTFWHDNWIHIDWARGRWCNKSWIPVMPTFAFMLISLRKISHSCGSLKHGRGVLALSAIMCLMHADIAFHLIHQKVLCNVYYVFKLQKGKCLLNLLIRCKGRCFIWSSCTLSLTLFSSYRYNKVQAAPLITSLSKRALHSKRWSVSSVLINDKTFNLEDRWLTEHFLSLWWRDSCHRRWVAGRW